MSDTEQGDEQVTAFEYIGGQPTIDAIVDDFYRNMDSLPEARDIRAIVIDTEHPSFERTSPRSTWC